MTFKERLLELIGESGMSYYRLERVTGISHNTVKSYMKGACATPRLGTLMVIAREFDVSLDYLAGVSDTRRRYGE